MPRRSARGFTLLELMVAVAVLAVMGAIAYRGLGAMARNAALTAEAAERFGGVTRAVSLLERDIRGAVPRPARDLLGATVPALAGGRERLALTRSGWDNPLGAPRSTLQRVTWSRLDDELVRVGWPVLDIGQGTDPVPQTVLTGVSTLNVEFLPASDAEWLGVWPPPSPAIEAATPWPVAVRVRLEVDGFGRLERVFVLAGPET